MGEVYRAEDLKLDQEVALKFLPATVAQDAGGLARFHSEVRLARQIAHPNVCRVYDIGEIGGEHFLSMEYVDGEDLASLLRRIGRLPRDKTVELARQLCAGLSAAHESGILHRDLKPANVMIDGRGRLKITDFGLAQAAGGAAEIAGTPAYIAPEQLVGAPASVRSDLYALGLILYEMVAGKPAFQTRSFIERGRVGDSTPPPLVSISGDVDPAVARTVERCLDPDPQGRPPSALAVAVALPGGDPLAAALAAGETPSPELVAAAGAVGSLRPWIAWSLGAAIIGGIVLWTIVSRPYTLHHLVPFTSPPAVLDDKARAILSTLGYDEPVDRVSGFIEHVEYLLFAVREQLHADGWGHLRAGRPAALLFWYREANVPLVPWTWASSVTPTDPPSAAGMRSIVLDTGGRLIQLVAAPTSGLAAGEAASPDWAPLFGAAELDSDRFQRAGPTGVIPLYADRRESWTGTFPEAPQFPITVEAASVNGTPVYFAIRGPWSTQLDPDAVVLRARRPLFVFLLALAVVLVVSGVLLAMRNIRLGRGDRAGGSRLAVAILALSAIERLLGSHHVAAPLEEARVLMGSVSWGLAMAVIVWIGYLALEPYVRRRWPDLIVSWTRLLSGRWRDPMVGRDVLIGGALGVLGMLLTVLNRYIATAVTGTYGMVFSTGPDTFAGTSNVFASVIDIFAGSVMAGFAFMCLLVVLTIVFRRRLYAVVVYWLVIGTVFMLAATTPLDRAMAWMPATLAVLLVVRFGVLAIASFHVFLLTLQSVPITFDFSVWYADRSIVGLSVLVLLAGFGVYTSLGGRPLATLRLPQDM